MDKIDRLLVIGDIHGKWEKFKSVYDKAGSVQEPAYLYLHYQLRGTKS